MKERKGERMGGELKEEIDKALYQPSAKRIGMKARGRKKGEWGGNIPDEEKDGGLLANGRLFHRFLSLDIDRAHLLLLV